MDYTERIIRERLDGKRNRVPTNFWNLETIAMTTIVIVEEKWGITDPKQIPIENMKYPLTLRLREDYNYFQGAIIANGYTFKAIILWIYQKCITEDDWYFIGNWEIFLDLINKGCRVPGSLCYNKKVLKSFMQYIVQEKWNIKDSNELPKENMKYPLAKRLNNEYPFLNNAIYHSGYFKDKEPITSITKIIGEIYNLSIEDWYFVDDIETLMNLAELGYAFPNYSVKYKDGLIYEKIIEYFINSNLDKLNRSNVYKKCENYLLRIFEQTTIYTEVDISWELIKMLPYSFQLWDFIVPQGFWENESNVRYYLNYEFHVRKRISEDSYNKISANFQKMCKHIGLSKLPNIAPLYSITYLRDMIVWEGPEYEHFINLRGKLESMNLHFGY